MLHKNEVCRGTTTGSDFAGLPGHNGMRKKLLFILTAMFLLSVSGLEALDMNFRLNFRTRGVVVSNKDLDKETGKTLGIIDSRLRLWMDSVFSENLKVVYGFEVGDVSWGDEVGIFGDDNDLGKSSGGAQATDGVNLETKHLYLQYRFADEARLRVGLQPFDTPCPFVIDSDLPAIRLQWDMLGLEWEAMYSHAFTGPRWEGTGDPAEQQYAAKDADYVNPDDDRDDYYLEVEKKLSRALRLQGWFLFDNNNRFKEFAPDYNQYSSDLFFWGFEARGKLGDALSYEGHFVLNTGSITKVGEGSEQVQAFALLGEAEYDFSRTFSITATFRMLSGNAPGATNSGDTVRQFHVLDGDDGDNESKLSLLFGGGAFNHQSYFDHKTATARNLNITKGYFVRNDPGITAIELYVDKDFGDDFMRLRLIGGYAMTTKAVLTEEGDEVRSLGTEFDLAARFYLAENLEWDVQLAWLLPGKALGPTLALDDPARYFGTDPAFKIETRLEVEM